MPPSPTRGSLAAINFSTNNLIKMNDKIDIKIGRWTITEKGITTKKSDNQGTRFYDKNTIWDIREIDDLWIYDLPVHLCTKIWVSNCDLLDFNSTFLVAQEVFKNNKPRNLSNVSWLKTLEIQYKRFKNSVDINSYVGRKKYEIKRKQMADSTFKEKLQSSQVNLNKKIREIEIYGDENSRKY